MRFLVKVKTIAISTILLAAMIFPTLATAQRSDLFFKSDNEDLYDNRDEITLHNNIGNDPFGVPVGSGLIVLTIAGAGYVIARRKRSLRNGTTLLLALTLMLGMTQCKKRIETVTHDAGNTIQITLRTSYDAKHYINLDQELGYSPVNFTSGDVIYVGDGMSCIGQLTYDNGEFSGNVTTPGSAATHLYFYYVGNLNPTWNTDNSAFTVDISNQKNDNDQNNNSKLLPVLSCARVVYESGVTNYECSLHNQCVLVRFEIPTNEGRTDEYRLSNMYSEAMVDFTSDVDPEIVPTGVLDAITLYCGPHNQLNNNNQNVIQLNYKYRWAILLKTEQARHAYIIRGDDEDSRTYYEMGDVGPFNPGDPADNYIYDTIYNNASNITSDRLFIVSTNGNVVQFSPGNLQYQASTNTWRFAEHQWDFVGDGTYGNVYATIGGVENTKCNNLNIDATYEGWIDLFGWGTWGYNKTPWLISTTTSDYSWSTDFQGKLSGHNDWRTLTYKEMMALNSYVKINAKGGKGTVNGTCVQVILPVNCSITYNHSKYNEGPTADELTLLNNNGAVFLPASGMRLSKTNIYNVAPSVGTSINKAQGYYWTSGVSSNDHAYYMGVTSGKAELSTASAYKYYGSSVRLVR